MSKILTTATAVVALAFATMGGAQARAINHNHHYVHSGYAGPVYSAANPQGGGFAWSAQHRNGYDGDRYWWGGWPTEPGAAIDALGTNNQRINDITT
jgi:hypothetical protein